MMISFLHKLDLKTNSGQTEKGKKSLFSLTSSIFRRWSHSRSRYCRKPLKNISTPCLHKVSRCIINRMQMEVSDPCDVTADLFVTNQH